MFMPLIQLILNSALLDLDDDKKDAHKEERVNIYVFRCNVESTICRLLLYATPNTANVATSMVIG